MTLVGDIWGVIPLKDGVLAGIVILIVLMILNDRLVTRKRLEEAREDGKAWRTSFETQQAVNAELGESVRELLPLARATHHALSSIQSLGRAHESPPEGGQS